jgi:WhiB family redox-sensing transcriptional regulator
MDWGRAKCQGLDPGIFFPQPPRTGGKTSPDKEKRTIEAAQYEVARKFCRSADGNDECPIRKECLEYAIANRQDYGVWGGYTEEGRRNLIRRRRRATAA